jgi:hypothetical protein
MKIKKNKEKSYVQELIIKFDNFKFFSSKFEEFGLFFFSHEACDYPMKI